MPLCHRNMKSLLWNAMTIRCFFFYALTTIRFEVDQEAYRQVLLSLNLFNASTATTAEADDLESSHEQIQLLSGLYSHT